MPDSLMATQNADQCGCFNWMPGSKASYESELLKLPENSEEDAPAKHDERPMNMIRQIKFPIWNCQIRSALLPSTGQASPIAANRLDFAKWEGLRPCVASSESHGQQPVHSRAYSVYTVREAHLIDVKISTGDWLAGYWFAMTSSRWTSVEDEQRRWRKPSSSERKVGEALRNHTVLKSKQKQDRWIMGTLVGAQKSLPGGCEQVALWPKYQLNTSFIRRVSFLDTASEDATVCSGRETLKPKLWRTFRGA